MDLRAKSGLAKPPNKRKHRRDPFLTIDLAVAARPTKKAHIASSPALVGQALSSSATSRLIGSLT